MVVLRCAWPFRCLLHRDGEFGARGVSERRLTGALCIRANPWLACLLTAHIETDTLSTNVHTGRRRPGRPLDHRLHDPQDDGSSPQRIDRQRCGAPQVPCLCCLPPSPHYTHVLTAAFVSCARAAYCRRRLHRGRRSHRLRRFYGCRRAAATPGCGGPARTSVPWSLHAAAGAGAVRRGPSRARTHTSTQQMKAEGRGRDAVWAHSTDFIATGLWTCGISHMPIAYSTLYFAHVHALSAIARGRRRA